MVWLPLLLLQAASSPAVLPDVALERTVAPFLAQHCIECHSGARPKGDLELDELAEPGPIHERSGTWSSVRARLERGEMPPADRVRPPQSEVDAVIAWIDARVARDARADEPVRPVLRRLNRAEYSNTIRDLLGVDFDAAAEFPSDDVGYGFDNIGAVLSIPDMLLEKYVLAAERIARDAVVIEDAANAPVQRVEGAKLSTSKQSNARGKRRVLFTNGDTGFDARFPRDGEYVLRARVWGDQAGPEACSAALRLGRDEKGRFEVPALEAAPQIVEARFRANAGKRRIAIAFLNDYYKPEEPDKSRRDRNLVVDWLELEGPVDPAVLSDFQRRILDPETRGTQRDVVAWLARRAWRRPVARDEVDRLMALAGTEEGFEAGVRVALQAVLVSPHFLFLVESDPAAASGPHAISDHELATRLSYFLWSSLPDEALQAVAGAGKLEEPDVLRAQVRRMLRDGRSSALSRNFAGQWLQTRALDRVTPDADLFPDWDRALAVAMRAETEMFFDAVLRERRSVLELVDADFTFVNERLAKHYGMAGVRGDEMRRVHLEPGARGGVLGLASVLTVTSNPTRTSPVKRGKWILENLLDAPTPPPPPGVGVLDESPKASASASLRERLEMHRTNVDCASCHARLDPLGFGLENFDATGAWRASEHGRAIDAAGDLPDGRKFDGPAELKALLKKDGSFVRCLARKLAVYALGRGLSEVDEAAVDDLVETRADSPALEDLIQGHVASELFRTRPGTAESAR